MKKLKIILLVSILVVSVFAGFIRYSLYEKAEKEKRETFAASMHSWAITQIECGSLYDKAGFVLSLIKEISSADEKQIRSRLDYRNKLIAKEKAGEITAKERLELYEKQSDIREFPKRVKLFDLFVPSQHNAMESTNLPYTHIGVYPVDRDNFVIAYDDGYTRWQAEGRHWDYFVAKKYSAFKESGRLEHILQKLETYEQGLRALFIEAQEQVESMTREQIKDQYMKQFFNEGGYLPNIKPSDFPKFLYKPETLSSDERSIIMFELARTRYLEQRCKGDYSLSPNALFH